MKKLITKNNILLLLAIAVVLYFRKKVGSSITTFFNPLAHDQQTKLAEAYIKTMQEQYPPTVRDLEVAQQCANLIDKVIIFDSDEDKIYTLIKSNIERKNFIKSAYGVRNLTNRKFFVPDNKNLLEAIASYFDSSRQQTTDLLKILN